MCLFVWPPPFLSLIFTKKESDYIVTREKPFKLCIDNKMSTHFLVIEIDFDGKTLSILGVSTLQDQA